MKATDVEVKKEFTEDEKQRFALIIRLDEDFRRKHAGKVRRVEVGHVCVDSGNVVIVDPCYLHDGKHGPNGTPDEYGLQHASEGWIEEKRMDEVMDIGAIDEKTGEARPAGPIYNGLAVASHTGYGDGTYPVYATILDGRVLKLEIEFA